MKKIFKRLAILTLCLSLIIPSITVHATEVVPPSPAGDPANSPSDGSGTAQGGDSGGTQQADTTRVTPEQVKEECPNVSDTYAERIANSLNAGEDTFEGVANLVKEEKKASSRVYGVNVYLAEIPNVSQTNKSVVAQTAEGLLMSGGGNPQLVKSIKLGGSAEDSASYGSYALWNTITTLDGKDVATFFECLTSLGVDESIKTKYQQQLQNYADGKPANLPVILCWPAVSSGGSMIDLYQIGQQGLSVCAPAAQSTNATAIAAALQAATGSQVGYSVLNGAGGGTLAGTRLIGSTSSYTGLYLFGAWATPLELEPGIVGGDPVTPSFFVTADPKKSGNIWASKPQVTGTYRLYPYIPQTELTNASGGYVDIEIKADFSQGSQPNAILKADSVTTKLSNEKAWENLLKNDTTSKIEITQGTAPTVKFHIPVSHIGRFNDTSIIYTATISGGSDTMAEEARPAMFSGTALGTAMLPQSGMEGIGFTASGTNGFNYTSWFGPPTLVDLPDTAYDKHTVDIPQGESLVVANSALDSEQQWDASIAIPSTENVSIKTGAEAGMADAYGWMCVRPAKDSYTPGDRALGANPDEVGSPATDPAAKRTITLKAMVTDCWGSDNPVCQLTRGVVASDSGGMSKTDSTNTRVWMEGCAGSYQNDCGSATGTCATQYRCIQHGIVKWTCSLHSGTPGWNECKDDHIGHPCSNGSCSDDEIRGHQCGGAGSSCSDQGDMTNSHNCTWSWTIYDSVNDDYLGKTLPLSGSATGVNTNHPLVSISRGANCGVNIHWSISWSPSQDQQYYIVNYKVWHTDIASGASGCHTLSGSKQTDFVDKSGSNSDGVLCNDYTHGTGTNVTHYENMVHKGTHTYTITYEETVDAYVYRTVENASVYTLTHISLDKVHTISTDSGKDVDGTEWPSHNNESAPLATSGGMHAVSVPDSVGYLWRCLGKNHGEYIDKNGRILWEGWVNSMAKPDAAGNVDIVRPEDYFLGDVTVELRITQDSEWATTIVNEDAWDTTSGEGMKERGVSMDHVHDHAMTTEKYKTTASDTKYLDITVGDQTRPGSGSGKTTIVNDDSQHSEVVVKELKHVLNYWSGINSGLLTEKQLFYKANILSDTLIYGGTESTNIFLEDAYSVDGTGEDRGVALFNMHAKPSNVPTIPGGGENSGGEITAYRQHQNATEMYGSTPKAMKDTIRADALSKSTVLDVGHMGLFGGVNSSGKGGTVGIDTALARQMQTAMTAFGLNCSGTKGDPVTYAGNVLKPEDNHNNHTGHGTTTIEAKTITSLASRTFDDAYWGPITYDCIGGGTTDIKVNGLLSGIGGFGTSDNGTACIEKYGTLAMSDIQLASWTPNGTWFTGQVGSHYSQSSLASGEIPESSDAPKPRTNIQDTHDKIVGDEIIAPCGANGSYYLNSIRIYNPLSAENDWVIGSQVGKFEESDTVTDDTDHDQRINELTGKYLRDEPGYATNTKPYVVQSQYLWTWLSPFGNFASVGGDGSTSTADMSKSGVGEHYDGHYGYVDNMQVGQWIGTSSIKYPFIAGLPDSITHTTKPYVELPTKDMLIAHGSSGNGGGKYSGAAQNSKLGSKFYWGNAFAVTNTSNVFESDMDNPLTPTSKVTMINYGINPYLKTGDSELSGTAKFGYKFAEESNAGDFTANAVYKDDPVNLVGSIGNVTIHDTEDFRFSNYFKEPTSEWLIEGVIKEADINKPIRVVSSLKDICFNDVTHYIQDGKIHAIDTKAPVTSNPPNKRGHATLGITIFNRDWSYGGMAGYYDPLPLVPHYNTVDEYRTEAIRLGYKSFISVDTIGQYQSYIYKDEVRPDGPGEADTRSTYLSVESEYYLYDFEDGKFYDVDIWSGSTGGKERIYNGTTKKTEQTTHAGAIYQEVRSDATRRNIGLFENALSQGFADATEDGGTAKYYDYTYYYSPSHYIGRPGSLKLDNRDLSYIGSESNFSEGRFWSESMIDSTGLNRNAQRYHFKDGLTSTSVITEPLGDNPTQNEIMDANQKVCEEHPYSVLVQFMNFTAVGEVWSIKHNGSAVMSPEFVVFDTDGDDPSDPDDDDKYLPHDWPVSIVKSHNTIKYQGTITYNPITGDPTGSIDKDSTPMVVYQAFNTSADDRTVSGTH